MNWSDNERTVTPHYVYACLTAGKRLNVRTWKKKQFFCGMRAQFTSDAQHVKDLWTHYGGEVAPGGYVFFKNAAQVMQASDKDLDMRYIVDCVAQARRLDTAGYAYGADHARIFALMTVRWQSTNQAALAAFTGLGGTVLDDNESLEVCAIVVADEETDEMHRAQVTVVNSEWVANCISCARIVNPNEMHDLEDLDSASDDVVDIVVDQKPVPPSLKTDPLQMVTERLFQYPEETLIRCDTFPMLVCLCCRESVSLAAERVKCHVNTKKHQRNLFHYQEGRRYRIKVKK